MNSEDGQVYSVCILEFSTVCSQNINKLNVNISDETFIKITAFSVGITILNQIIFWKDDIEFVTEFPCLLGHPVRSQIWSFMNDLKIICEHIFVIVWNENAKDSKSTKVR